MVEDVVEVESLDAYRHAGERNALEHIFIQPITQYGFLDAVVIARLAVIEVNAEHRTVKTQFKLFLGIVVADASYVERVAQEQPSPAQIWPDFHRRPWGKGDRLSRLAFQGIYLIGVGVLHHHRIVIVLRLNVIGVDVVEMLEPSGKHLSDASEHGFSLLWFHHHNSVCFHTAVFLLDRVCLFCSSRSHSTHHQQQEE